MIRWFYWSIFAPNGFLLRGETKELREAESSAAEGDEALRGTDVFTLCNGLLLPQCRITCKFNTGETTRLWIKLYCSFSQRQKLEIRRDVRSDARGRSFLQLRDPLSTKQHNHTAALWFDRRRALTFSADTICDEERCSSFSTMRHLFRSGPFRRRKTHITMTHYVFLH